MGIYVIIGLISFFAGWLASYLFQRFVSVEVKIKKSEIKPKVFTDPRLQKIQIMLEEIKRCGTIPVKIPKAAEKSLMLIAQTKDWDKQIDEETIKTLNKIYNSWQLHIESEKKTKLSKSQKVGEGEGFNNYFEGTPEEYFDALRKGLINKNTHCTIYEKAGTYEMNENGSWEEVE